VLRPLFDEILLIANDAAPFAAYRLRVVPDLHPGRGPLAGLESALDAALHNEVFLVAGDLPLLDARAIDLVLSAAAAAPAVVIDTARGPEPLHARYARSLLPRVRAALAAGRLAMHAFLDEIAAARIPEAAARAIDPALRFLDNVNTPDDAARLTALLARS
jgi:molybdopterin-guanine dinucleotide biosynthesis protein A